MPGPASVGRMAALCAALLAPCHVGAANDNGATTSPDSSTPSWLYDNELQLMLPNSPTPSQNYPVLPLTPGMGLNGTDNAGLAISITGTIVAVDSANYNQVRDPHQVAYLSCDNNESSHITPDMMLNYLMSVKPKAIILYSEKSETHWCSFDRNDGPDYSSIVTMADSSDARMVLKYLTSNSTSNSMMVSITGKASNTYEQNPKSGSNSAVAMSVLYSVTGLITLLFLIIIATGTIRAHRNPERYGPRGGVGGRGRQSRAKGLARAVLDTIPIVKFGNNEPAKQDPEVELETQRIAPQEDQRQDATTNQESRNPQVSGAIGPNDSRDGQTKPNDQTDAKSTHDSNQGDGPNLGCSICTEDFTVGEDVRVLPCHHQFHPSCIDPWLVDVSGTCPLCRLDLQPGQGTQEGQDRDLPPPLSMDQDDAADLQNRNRLSRLLTSAGFRQLPREEQMAALRQMREYNAQSQQGAADAEAGPGAAATADENVAADGDDRTRRARFAAKLKEKFRIRTREQS